MHMKIHLEFLLFVCQTNNSTFLFKTAHFIWRMGKNVACVIYVCCNQCWARDNYWASWVPIKQDNNVSTCVRAPKTCKKRKIFSLTGVKTELPQHNWTHQSTILLTLKHCHVVARVAASAQLRYKWAIVQRQEKKLYPCFRRQAKGARFIICPCLFPQACYVGLC